MLHFRFDLILLDAYVPSYLTQVLFCLNYCVSREACVYGLSRVFFSVRELMIVAATSVAAL